LKNICNNIGGGCISSKYPVQPSNKIIKAMSKLGFEKCHKSILEQADIELEEFLKIYKLLNNKS